MSGSPRLHGFRQRIAKMVRRAEKQPERAFTVVADEVRFLLSDVSRLVSTDPEFAAEILFLLLERLPPLLTHLEEQRRGLDEHVETIIGRLQQMLHEPDSGLDPNHVAERVFELWADDHDGALAVLEETLLDLAKRGAEARLITIVQRRLAGMSLPFASFREGAEDLERTLLRAERHRLERLLGELLALKGVTEYAVVIARDHYVRTGDATDLVMALRRNGDSEEALVTARRALASPRSFQRSRLRALLDELLGDSVTGTDRETRKALEEDFLCTPSLKAFRALKAVVPDEQWPRVSGRILGHLQKHQKSPELLFRLYLDEGKSLDADGLVVTQPIDPDELLVGARRIASEHPDRAAGWILTAVHRRLTTGLTVLYPRAVTDLLEVRRISLEHGQHKAFDGALESIRRRYARRAKFLALLEEAGL